MKKIAPFAFLLLSALLVSCVSTPPALPPQPAVVAKPVESTELATMRELRVASRAAFESSHPIEALRHLVALLALDREASPEPDQAKQAERTELVRKADAELTEIGARFTLEPTDEWLSDGKQLNGNLRDLAKGKGLQPSVRLVVNYDFGKAVVADAPIRFAFTEGLGEIGVSGGTDASGVAAATVRGIARTDKPVVIRAVLAVSSRGMTKVFNEVFRDFTYLPPNRTVRVMALERVVSASSGAKTTADHSPLIGAVARGLASSGAESILSDGVVDPALFMSVYNGEPKAAAKAAAYEGIPVAYLAVALCDCDEPKQLVLQGKAYRIFTANVRANVRILRPDGSSAIVRPQIATRGQGGSPEGALNAAFTAVRDAVEKDLIEASAEIRAAFD